jgi:UDP-N-acetylmuramate dehydrogenase
MPNLRDKAREFAHAITASARFAGDILFDEQLSFRTTMATGGTAPLFVLPSHSDALVDCLNTLEKAGVPLLILGGGSNVVFPDGEFERVVVSTEMLDKFTVQKNGAVLRCGAGCRMEAIVDYCAKHRLGGLEEFAGLPGTVGGAAVMNARCYDKEICDVLVNAEFAVLAPQEGSPQAWRVEEYRVDKKDWGYKKSPFQGEKCVVIEVSLAVKALTEVEITGSLEKMAGFLADRVRKRHFDFPSAGSVFKNNHEFGKPSGKIIDEAGLCGYRIGGAEVAPWHGNIIINTEHATSSDVRALKDYVAKAVFDKFGFALEPEIIFL